MHQIFFHPMFSFSVDYFFNDTATTEIYTYRHTLSLHDALPIYDPSRRPQHLGHAPSARPLHDRARRGLARERPDRLLRQQSPTHLLALLEMLRRPQDRKSTRLNSSH